VIRILRTVLGLAFLVGALWAAFAVDLGGRTFAEHIDTISDTPEAEELIEGTRATINPALQEVRDRVLGEYVEAPTWIPDQGHGLEPGVPEGERSVPASTLPPAARGRAPAGAEPPLPGRPEPPLPGRRERAQPAEPAPALASQHEPGEGRDLEPPLPGRR
jgi:hypothetical protein